MLADPKEGLAKFGLRLHEDKTRLIAFGRFAASTRHKRGERRPETFAFLGFTHYCGRTRDGRFIVKHKTQSNRLTRKLTALRQEAWRPMHRPLAEQHRWYASVLRGHYGYFGMPHNWWALNGFLRELRRIWFNCLKRRSQKNRRMGWDWFEIVTSSMPTPCAPTESSRLPLIKNASDNSSCFRTDLRRSDGNATLSERDHLFERCVARAQ